MRLALVAILLAGCTGGPADLFVDLRTDLRAPSEFSAVRVIAARPDGGEPLAEEVTATLELEGDLLDGVRVAGVPDLDHGPVLVTVDLLDPVGTVVLSRRLLVRLRGDLVVTAVMTRSCVAVTCPGPGDDASLTECLGGRCVTEGCVDAVGGCGEPECGGDADCAAGPSCARGRCVEGACLYQPDDGACAGGMRCDVVVGCTSECDEALCDDSNPCTDDACDAGGACVSTPNTARCDDEVFCNGPDTCEAGACGVHEGDPCAAPTVCDEGAGTCVGCAGDPDCPDPIDGPWSACGGFDETCDETGTRVRTVTSFTCVSSRCEPGGMMEAEACMRTRDGTSCGPGGAACASGSCVCPGGTTEAMCGDSVDDDCDGDTDCADADCSSRSCGASGEVCAGGACVCPGGSVEATCDNATDDDCDGDTDCEDADCDGVTCAPGRACASGMCACPLGPAISVTDGTLAPSRLSMLMAGSEIGFIYTAGSPNDIQLARATSAGAVVAADIQLTSSGSIAVAPRAAWIGSEYAVTWSDTRLGSNDVFLARFAPSGASSGAEVTVAATPSVEIFPSVGSSGSELGIAWSTGNGADQDLSFRRYSLAGTPLGAGVRSVNTPDFIDRTEMVALPGGTYAVAYHEIAGGSVHAYLTVLNAAGMDADGPDLVDAGAGAALVDLAYDGGQLGLVWRDARHASTEIYFASATAAGAPGANVRVTNDAATSNDPRVEAGGGGFGVAWVDDRGGGIDQIWFQQLTSSGASLGGPRALSCAIVSATNPDIVWTGSEWAVGWVENDGGATRVMLRVFAP